MTGEARLVRTDAGLDPEGEGWYVVNAREAGWRRREGFGATCTFEGDVSFDAYGINIHVLDPGERNGLYHAEEEQEDFLVLAGECLLLVEGEERRLGQWDFVHCPRGTEHIFVGAGNGPCAILMAGSRTGGGLLYPVSELARSHGAGVERETTRAREAYAGFAPWEPAPYRDGDLPGD